jgi:hypothetical protein
VLQGEAAFGARELVELEPIRSLPGWEDGVLGAAAMATRTDVPCQTGSPYEAADLDAPERILRGQDHHGRRESSIVTTLYSNMKIRR